MLAIIIALIIVFEINIIITILMIVHPISSSIYYLRAHPNNFASVISFTACAMQSAQFVYHTSLLIGDNTINHSFLSPFVKISFSRDLIFSLISFYNFPI